MDILKRIQDYALEDIMGDRFGAYAKEIIQDRAIPDVIASAVQSNFWKIIKLQAGFVMAIWEKREIYD